MDLVGFGPKMDRDLDLEIGNWKASPMKPKIGWKTLAIFLVVGLALLVVGIILMVQNNRYASVAFGLLGAISGGLSLFMLIRWSKQV